MLPSDRDIPGLPPSAFGRVWVPDAIDYIMRVRVASDPLLTPEQGRQVAEWFFRQALQSGKLRLYHRLSGPRARGIHPRYGLPRRYHPEHVYVLEIDLSRLLKPFEPSSTPAPTPTREEAPRNVSAAELKRLTEEVIAELKKENMPHSQERVHERVNTRLEPRQVSQRRVNSMIAELGETLAAQRPRTKSAL